MGRDEGKASFVLVSSGSGVERPRVFEHNVAEPIQDGAELASRGWYTGGGV